MDDARINDMDDPPRTPEQASFSATGLILNKSPILEFESNLASAYDLNSGPDLDVDLSFENINREELFTDLGVGVDLGRGEGSDPTFHGWFHSDPNAFANENHDDQAYWAVNEHTDVIDYAIQAAHSPASPPSTLPILLSVKEESYAPADPSIAVTPTKPNSSPPVLQYATIADPFVDPPGAASSRAMEDTYHVPSMIPVLGRRIPDVSPTPEGATTTAHLSDLCDSHSSSASSGTITRTFSVPQARRQVSGTTPWLEVREQSLKATPKSGSAQEELMKQVQLQAAEQHYQPQLRDARCIIAEQKIARKRRLDNRVAEELGPLKRTCIKTYAEETAPAPSTPISAHQYADLPLIPSLSNELLGSSIPELGQEPNDQQIILHAEPPLNDADLHIIRVMITYMDCPTTRDSFTAIDTVDTYWINNATHTVWNTMRLLPAAYNQHVREQLQRHAVMFPYEKYQVLNRAGYLGMWWWLREALVEHLRRQGTSINDSAMVHEWEKHRQAIKEMQVSARHMTAIVGRKTSF